MQAEKEIDIQLKETRVERPNSAISSVLPISDNDIEVISMGKECFKLRYVKLHVAIREERPVILGVIEASPQRGAIP